MVENKAFKQFLLEEYRRAVVLPEYLSDFLNVTKGEGLRVKAGPAEPSQAHELFQTETV